MANILLPATPLPPAFLQAFASFGELLPHDRWQDAVGEVAILLSTALDPINAATIRALPANVRLIANVGVGTDNIDLDAAKARGIAVSNTPVVTEDTADLAFALLMATCRRLPYAEAGTRRGDWPLAEIGMSASRVHSKILGIVGLGAIGQAVARRAQGFGMQVLYHTPQPKSLPAGLQAEYRGLAELLAEADIVSLHCPLTPATRHLLNANTFALMKPDAIVINTGRGALIEEEALVSALSQGQIRAAGLDVYEHEPDIHPQLRKMENVVLLPHIGSATMECRRDMVMSVIANIQSHLQTGEPINRVI